MKPEYCAVCNKYSGVTPTSQRRFHFRHQYCGMNRAENTNIRKLKIIKDL